MNDAAPGAAAPVEGTVSGACSARPFDAAERFAGAGIPAAMTFVRNQNGSHNLEEAMDIDDVIKGFGLPYATLLESGP